MNNVQFLDPHICQSVLYKFSSGGLFACPFALLLLTPLSQDWLITFLGFFAWSYDSINT